MSKVLELQNWQASAQIPWVPWKAPSPRLCAYAVLAAPRPRKALLSWLSPKGVCDVCGLLSWGQWRGLCFPSARLVMPYSGSESVLQ